MNVTVFGTGYVGLVQAAALAEVGHEVVCIDIDAAKIDALRAGVVPIFEPGLEALVQHNFAAGRLHFDTDPAFGVHHGDIIFIAVGTPPDEDGAADLQYVLAVAQTIGQHMSEYKILVTKSTVPVGTSDKVEAKVAETLAERGVALQFDVVSNPEFLKEGAAVNDCLRPDRIILGLRNPACEDVMRELYEPFNRNHDKLIVMDVRSAELTKYAANCMLATKISFMNEMANLAERLGADIEKVRIGIGSDPRIGYHFIYPGCGFGGSCFPKDVRALCHTAQEVGYQASLLDAVEQVNQQQKEKLFELVRREFGSDLRGRTFALWGLTFKPNTDDMREAPSRVLMEQLWAAGARIQAFDPKGMEETQRIYGNRPDLQLFGTKESALYGADALLICTEWQVFRAPDFDVMKDLLKQPLVFDGRNLYEPERMKRRGFIYYAIGRGASLTD